MLKDKRLLNNIFKRVGKQEFKFFSNVGFVFGFGIGVIQMLCWIVTQGKYPWMLPLFGGFVGFFSDWIALQMMFRPLYPKRYWVTHGKVCLLNVKMKLQLTMQL